MADLKSRRTQSTTASIMTPPATDDHEPTIVDGPWNGLSYAVPWPGSLFIIVEKSPGSIQRSAPRRIESSKALRVGEYAFDLPQDLCGTNIMHLFR